VQERGLDIPCTLSKDQVLLYRCPATGKYQLISVGVDNHFGARSQLKVLKHQIGVVDDADNFGPYTCKFMEAREMSKHFNGEFFGFKAKLGNVFSGQAGIIFLDNGVTEFSLLTLALKKLILFQTARLLFYAGDSRSSHGRN
jgi:hypothetical protein